MIVHQLLSGAGPVDAVTAQARAFRELFAGWGWGGRDHAVWIDPRMGSSVAPLAELRAEPDDVLLLHYSAYAPRMRDVLELPNRKLLLSHNVTPARWFWDHDPAIAVRCALGRRHLPAFAAGVDAAAAVSRYNALELEQAGARDVSVIPVLFDPAAWGEAGSEAAAAAPRDVAPSILFVGRLTPHKRQDELIRAFSLYRSQHSPRATLTLVGEPLNPRYGERLAELAAELAPGAVSFERSLSREALAERYRRADVFLCMSEHEGFCVPLLEAFHFGVAVIARPIGGIPEVAGDAALLVEDDDLAVVAELVDLVVGDADLRGELAQRGRARLAAFDPATTAARLRAFVQG